MAYGETRFPIDITDVILNRAQEVSVFRAISAKRTLRQYSWYEQNFTVGSLGFAPGTCPPTLTENAATLRSVTLKNVGIGVSVPEQVIRESAALMAATLEYPTTQGDLKTIAAENELRFQIEVATAHLLSKLDELLVKGNATSDPLVFDGIENIVTSTNGAVFQDTSTAPFDFDTFSAFVQSLGGGSTHVFGHPMALAQVYKAAMAAGGATPMFIVTDGMVPGLGFGSKIATLGGVLTLVPDRNFTVTPGTGDFTTDLFVLNINDVFRAEFDPITYVPKPAPTGCLVVEGLVYTMTALVIQNLYRQGRFRAKFSGSPSMAVPLM